MVCMPAVQAVTLPIQRLLKACLRFFASGVLPLKLKASVCTFCEFGCKSCPGLVQATVRSSPGKT